MKQKTIHFLKEVGLIYWDLLKVMVPVMVAVKVAVQFGLIETLGQVFAPIVAVAGLTPELGLVWVTAMLVNIYAGAAALVAFLPGQSVSGAEATVLGVMILVAHSLPVEQRITQKAGPGLIFTTLLRILAALLLGILLFHGYQFLGVLQQPISIDWLPQTAQDAGWFEWGVDSVISLTTIFFILLALMLLLKLLDYFGITRWLTLSMSPLMRIMGMSDKASTMTMAGVLLGITYGAALILREARSGRVDRRDVFLSACFLCLCHSVIEDTLFIMALGAHWSGVLLARFVFSVIVIYLLSRVMARVHDDHFERYFFNSRLVANTIGK